MRLGQTIWIVHPAVPQTNVIESQIKCDCGFEDKTFQQGGHAAALARSHNQLKHREQFDITDRRELVP